MKNTILSLFLNVLFLTAFAQVESNDLKKYSPKELQALKEKAVAEGQFLLADKINKEILSRKTTNEIKIELQSKLKQVVAKEDYKEAEKIKIKLSKINEIEEIETEIKIALQNDDYLKAQNLKEQKEEMLSYIFETNLENPKSNINSINKNGKTNILISLDSKSSNQQIFDIFIDGIYYGSVNNKQSLGIKNIEPGIHRIELRYLNTFSDKRSFIYKEELNSGNFEIKLNYYKNSELVKLINQNKKLTEQQKLDAKKIYTIEKINDSNNKKSNTEQTFLNPQFKKPNQFSGTTRYTDTKTSLSGYKKPENATKFASFNINQQFTTPIAEGFIIGFSWGTNLYNYSYEIDDLYYPGGKKNIDNTNYGFNLNAVFGYQIELIDEITFQSYISAGPSLVNSYSSINFTSNTNTAFGGFWGSNLFFFLDKRQILGVSTGLIVGFNGGVGGTLGLVVSSKKFNYRHLYYN